MKFPKAIYVIFLFSVGLYGQEAYFVDGFHGGIWGHYPEGYTEYILSLLEEDSDWRLNLEIEPETWDRTMVSDSVAYKRMQGLLSDRSSEARVEYVNPTYAQSYFFNTSGESIIRQFFYGIKKLKNHFPQINFNTYSTEEPCFTSALPQILSSFGIKNASLKNPNTCWGGYTRAHGGELVNWIGPDGTEIVTVPRYKIEKLKSGSTWETIANANSLKYIKAAFDYGVDNPVGMTLQDAGWKEGPWLKGGEYKPSIYTTWHNYFKNIANQENITDWKFDQEDVLVSLVWGSQVLQKLAQQVKKAENNIIQAEKIASINMLDEGEPYPEELIDEGWRTLLLSQHHDCWIVPYNSIEKSTWAEKAKSWTNKTNLISENIINRGKSKSGNYIKVYNSLGEGRSEYLKIELPEDFDSRNTAVIDATGKKVPVQEAADNSIVFKADVPTYGYKVFKLKEEEQEPSKTKTLANKTASGDYLIETDIYKIEVDGENGSITSLIAKKIGNKEFVDQQAALKFNSLKGNFNKNGGFHTNTEKKTSVKIIENGPYRVKLEVNSFLLDTPVKQIISLSEGEEHIDFNLRIEWNKNVQIGESKHKDYEHNDRRKPFYNDKYKLLANFPLNLENQRVFKNAPFDVLESGLENTFYNSWDSIKNNIILDWVDVTNKNMEYGIALFTDHTTTYAHGRDFPLALNIQYSGAGLWGRNHTIQGPTEINYSLLPHKGNWKEAKLWQKSARFKEPLKPVLNKHKPSVKEKSLIAIEKEGWRLSSVYIENTKLLVRIFNVEGNAKEGVINFRFNPGKVALVELNGERIEELPVEKLGNNYRVRLVMPQFGFRTIKLQRNK